MNPQAPEQEIIESQDTWDSAYPRAVDKLAGFLKNRK
jgi:hypothetical protein